VSGVRRLRKERTRAPRMLGMSEARRSTPAPSAAPAGPSLSLTGLLGSVLLALSVFVPWVGDIGSSFLGIGSDSDPALDSNVPFVALFDFGDEEFTESAFSLGLVLLLLAIIGAALSFTRATAWRRAIGVVVLVIWVLFTIQMIETFWEPDEIGEFFTKWYGLGAFLGLIAGILMVAGRAPRAPAREGG
jgi:hypothetical protein